MEEKLIKEYIGKNANEIMNSNMNWVSAILGQAIGPIWFFYRKSFLLGFLFIITTVIIFYIIYVIKTILVYSFIMFVIYLFTSNKLYLWDVKRKVNKILLNENIMSEEQLIDYAKKKGGTNNWAAVIYIICFICFIIFIFIYSILIFSHLFPDIIPILITNERYF